MKTTIIVHYPATTEAFMRAVTDKAFPIDKSKALGQARFCTFSIFPLWSYA